MIWSCCKHSRGRKVKQVNKYYLTADMTYEYICNLRKLLFHLLKSQITCNCSDTKRPSLTREISVRSEKDEDDFIPMNTEVLKEADILSTLDKAKTSTLCSITKSQYFYSQDPEDKLKVPEVSFWQVLKLNKPEWKSVTAASICSIMVGFSMPLLAVILGDFIGVRFTCLFIYFN